jgi:ribonucleotide reductase beta subunit family protein with ferritin-like domain
MINRDEKIHEKYVVNIIFDGASPWNYLQTTEMGSLMYGKVSDTIFNQNLVMCCLW